MLGIISPNLDRQKSCIAQFMFIEIAFVKLGTEKYWIKQKLTKIAGKIDPKDKTGYDKGC